MSIIIIIIIIMIMIIYEGREFETDEAENTMYLDKCGFRVTLCVHLVLCRSGCQYGSVLCDTVYPVHPCFNL